MTDHHALITQGLSKQFGSLKSLDDRKGYAVKDLNITVEQGDIYGFLGPNYLHMHALALCNVNI